MPDTTNRPTIRDIADDPDYDKEDRRARRYLIGDLAEHGYVIVSVDDIPDPGEPNGVGEPAAGYRSGWRDCRDYIFRTGKHA